MTTETKMLNGIDLEHVHEKIKAIKDDPRQAETNWKVCSQWKGGTRSDHAVAGCTIGGKFVPRSFVMKADEPNELAGTNAYPNPQEYLLAGLNACMMVGYAAAASMMGVRLTKLEIGTSGDIDLHGFLGLDKRVAPGYGRLTQVIRIAGNGTPEQFAQMHEIVRNTSPNLYNLTQPVAVDSRMVVE